MSPSAHPDVRRIGIADWSQRKGRIYGSVIIELDRSMNIDLLDDREQESFGIWLEKHRSVELTSRDRSTNYSAAIASSGRKITEVADKFHLIKNIQDRFTKVLSEHYSDYRLMVRNEEQATGCPNENFVDSKKEGDASNDFQKKTDSRQVMFDEVKELQAKGLKPATISRKLGISRQTATKYCSMNFLPQRGSKHRNGYEKLINTWRKKYRKGKPCQIYTRKLEVWDLKEVELPFMTIINIIVMDIGDIALKTINRRRKKELQMTGRNLSP